MTDQTETYNEETRERIRELERQNERLRAERDRLKADSSLHSIDKEKRFQFIDDHRQEFPVSVMCDVLDVSRSGYYAWRGRPPNARDLANRKLYKQIKEIHDESNGRYGSPRIHRELKRRGVPCSENRVARLMRKHGLRAVQ